MLGRGIDRGPRLNRAVWSVTGQVVWQLLRSDDNALRRQLGLRPLPLQGPAARQQREAMPVYYAYSPAVLPRPADWPERMLVTGYWFLDPPPGWQPPDGLARFLADGPPPVSIGFGSMASRDPQATLDLALRALDLSGQRGCCSAAGPGSARTAPCPGTSSPPTASRTADCSRGWPRSSATAEPGPPVPRSAPESPRSSPRWPPTSPAGHESSTTWAPGQPHPVPVTDRRAAGSGDPPGRHRPADPPAGRRPRHADPGRRRTRTDRRVVRTACCLHGRQADRAMSRT